MTIALFRFNSVACFTISVATSLLESTNFIGKHCWIIKLLYAYLGSQETRKLPLISMARAAQTIL